jgi:hypothetical protein
MSPSYFSFDERFALRALRFKSGSLSLEGKEGTLNAEPFLGLSARG